MNLKMMRSLSFGGLVWASCLVVGCSKSAPDEGKASGGTGNQHDSGLGGGATSGGSSSGGGSNTGGQASGGAATGGTASGGSATGGTASGGAATGGSSTGGGDGDPSGDPSVSTEFLDLSNWGQRDDSDGGSISIVPHAAATDNSVLQLTYPGNPALGPGDNPGPAHAVEVFTNQTLHYGRYEMSVRFASCADDEELVNGIFTYFNDGSDENENGIADNSEIDYEVLCGEPHLLWLTVWTDYGYNADLETEEFRKTTRVIDMRNGSYQQTPVGSEDQYGVGPGGTISGISETDFPNPDRFYDIAFEWQPTYVRYTIRLGDQEVELWKLEGAERVPQRPGQFMLNLWHANTHWLKGGAADYPKAEAQMLVDWVKIWQ